MTLFAAQLAETITAVAQSRVIAPASAATRSTVSATSGDTGSPSAGEGDRWSIVGGRRSHSGRATAARATSTIASFSAAVHAPPGCANQSHAASNAAS